MLNVIFKIMHFISLSNVSGHSIVSKWCPLMKVFYRVPHMEYFSGRTKTPVCQHGDLKAVPQTAEHLFLCSATPFASETFRRPTGLDLSSNPIARTSCVFITFCPSVFCSSSLPCQTVCRLEWATLVCRRGRCCRDQYYWALLSRYECQSSL